MSTCLYICLVVVTCTIYSGLTESSIYERYENVGISNFGADSTEPKVNLTEIECPAGICMDGICDS